MLRSMLRKGGLAGIGTRDLSIASPMPYRSANTPIIVAILWRPFDESVISCQSWRQTEQYPFHQVSSGA